MDALLYAGLVNAVAATVLALFAAAASRVCRRPALVHALWLLVLLKLVTPPLWNVPVFDGAASASSEEVDPERAARPEIPEVIADLIMAPAGGVVEPVLPDAFEESAPAAPSEAEASDWPWRELLLCFWAVGALSWWLLAAIRLRRFERLLRTARPGSAALNHQVARLSALLRLRRPPAILLVPAEISPMLLALGRSPRLLLPAALWDRLDPDQQGALLLHELAHLRRGDPWVRRLELVVLGLYWWHPVVWWARAALQEAEEQCCDGWVVSAMPSVAGAYATALIATGAFLSSNPAPLPFAASGAGHVPLLKRRLAMILQGTSSHRLSRFAFWGVLAAAVLLLPLAPGARTQAPPQSPSKADAPSANQAPQAPPADPHRFGRHDHFLPDRVANACQTCHQLVPMPLLAQGKRDQKAASWQEAHDEVVRLLDEVKARRRQLQEAEDRLARALELLNRTDPQPFRWNVSWADAMFRELRWDFGNVRQGLTVVHDFPIKNNSQYLIRIRGLRTSGGYLTAVLSHRQPGELAVGQVTELPPKGQTSVRVQVDTSKFVGAKTGRVFVQLEMAADKVERTEAILEVQINSQGTAPAGPKDPARLQDLEKRLDDLRKEMEQLRRQFKPTEGGETPAPDSLSGGRQAGPVDGLAWANKLFNVTAIDFGKIRPQTEYTIPMRNIYKVPVEIADVRVTDADCLTYTVPKRLNPNETGAFHIQVHRDRFKGEKLIQLYVKVVSGTKYQSTATLTVAATS